MNWVEKGVNDYYDWLKNRTTIQQDGSTGWNVISTPFVGLFNDTIDLFVRMTEEGKVLLSDDGVTINNLDLLGVSFKSGIRKPILDRVKYNYGVQIDKNGEISKEVELGKFPQGKHDMIRAIMELSDLAPMSTHRAPSLFREDVKAYFRDNNVNVTPSFIIQGRSGINFTFDYMMSFPEKEVLLQLFNNLTKGNLATFLFGIDEVTDPKKISEKELESVAIVNDVESEVKPEFIQALMYKGTKYVPWSTGKTSLILKN